MPIVIKNVAELENKKIDSYQNIAAVNDLDTMLIINDDSLYSISAQDLMRYIKDHPHIATHYTSKKELIEELNLKLDKTEKGMENGVSPLNENGKIPSDHILFGKTSGTTYQGSDGKILEDNINIHKLDFGNPHKITAATINLGNVDDTSDADKPVSIATQNAISAAIKDVHTHSNKAAIDGITTAKITYWDTKSSFDGNYNSLLNKPPIPTKTSQLTNDCKFIQDAKYVHTDNNFTSSYMKKLDESNILISAPEYGCIKLMTIDVTSSYSNIPLSFQFSGRSSSNKGVTSCSIFFKNVLNIDNVICEDFMMYGDTSFANSNGLVLYKVAENGHLFELWIKQRQRYEELELFHLHGYKGKKVLIPKEFNLTLPTDYYASYNPTFLNSDNYDGLNEQKIGVFSNGKCIYRKVITGEITNKPTGTITLGNFSFLDIENIIKISGSAFTDANKSTIISIPTYINPNAFVGVWYKTDTKTIHMSLGTQFSSTNFYYTLIIEYIKT